MTLRDELLAKMEEASLKACGRSSGLANEAMLDVVLASGERRWFCAWRSMLATPPNAEGDCTECYGETDKCRWVLVLPVSLREGEQGDG